MILLRRAHFRLLFIAPLLTLVILLALQGCAGVRQHVDIDKGKSGKTAKPPAEASAITPTKEMAGLYNAIQGATRVVISESNRGLLEEDREAIPLSYFTSKQSMFYDVMRAVTSATPDGEP
ncbi:MAG TPA: hypothetical protein VE439_01690 [Anaerolineae bacterium]|jgi:hypothetical protein|nr:hypothetical protein [Anaerolineae bacterium]